MAEEADIRRVPIVAVRGSVIFPHTDTLLSFGRPKSTVAISTAFQEDRVIAIFTQKDARTSDPGEDDLYKVGTIATITQMMSTEGEIHALVRGQARIKLHEIISREPYLLGKVIEIKEQDLEADEVKALASELTDLFKKAINLGKQAEIMSVMRLISGPVEPLELVDQVAGLLDTKVTEKQKLLEILSVKRRMQRVMELMAKEVNILDLEKTISSKTQQRFEDQMRKAMLREKKRTIEEELGEEEGEISTDEAKEYKEKIIKAKMPKEVREKAEKELKKLIQLSPHNPEGGYIRNYLDWLVEVPWSTYSPNNVSIKNAAKILEERHYGMKKAKERILEFLAVMKIKKSVKGKGSGESQPTILCFIGPPGVGKTSIGKSIAEALGRKFVRVSLGGIRDEAEIRGHRRTYVGALPGRIIQGMKNAGTKNPVFMLDEIDKIGTDFRGDPSSALLDALDPEQNNAFSDHYLEVAYDLSDVMFITTANILDTIPPALRDRLEIINFPGYTEEEKFHIAKSFLIPKQLKSHGLTGKNVEIADHALKEIIDKYTREAGVRELEREIAAVLRKVAKKIATNKSQKKIRISPKQLRSYLGPHKFSKTIAETKDEIGMSTGLYVTAAGGGILFIEVNIMPGKGQLILTGQLGDVMKESAQAALSYVRMPP